MFYVDEERCNSCGNCVDVCTQGAINIRNGKAFIENGLCIECGMCLTVCTMDAIHEAVIPAIGVGGPVDTKWERREVSAMPVRGWFGRGSTIWGGYGMSRGLGRGSGFGRGGHYGRGQFGCGQGFGRGRGLGRSRPSCIRGFGRRW